MPHQQPRGMCPAQVCRKPKLNHQNTPKPTGRMTEEVAKGLPACLGVQSPAQVLVTGPPQQPAHPLPVFRSRAWWAGRGAG